MSKSTWVFLAILSVLIAGGLAYRHFAQELDSRGATRLMRALEENDTDKVEDLLDEADVNARDKAGQTALFYAARHVEQPQIIHKLILAGADPLSTDKHGYTPLMAAAQFNPQPAIIKVLARQGKNSPAQQHNKNRALMIAAQHNTFPIIKMLLIAHANPSAHDEQGRQAADYLAENAKLSDMAKTDLRQVMMLLEILEAREQFATNYAEKQNTKPTSAPAVQPSTARKPIEKKMETSTADKPAVKEGKPATPATTTPTKPVEKAQPTSTQSTEQTEKATVKPTGKEMAAPKKP